MTPRGVVMSACGFRWRRVVFDDVMWFLMTSRDVVMTTRSAVMMSRSVLRLALKVGGF
jgi:hypothetical protein